MKQVQKNSFILPMKLNKYYGLFWTVLCILRAKIFSKNEKPENLFCIIQIVLCQHILFSMVFFNPLFASKSPNIRVFLPIFNLPILAVLPVVEKQQTLRWEAYSRKVPGFNKYLKVILRCSVQFCSSYTEFDTNNLILFQMKQNKEVQQDALVCCKNMFVL